MKGRYVRAFRRRLIHYNREVYGELLGLYGNLGRMENIIIKEGMKQLMDKADPNYWYGPPETEYEFNPDTNSYTFRFVMKPLRRKTI